MKKLFENFRRFQNETLTKKDKERKKDLEKELDDIHHK